jgi:hypothetical protein
MHIHIHTRVCVCVCVCVCLYVFERKTEFDFAGLFMTVMNAALYLYT